jgi:Zn-finger protein
MCPLFPICRTITGKELVISKNGKIKEVTFFMCGFVSFETIATIVFNYLHNVTC